MVLITIVTGAYKPTNITGGPHSVELSNHSEWFSHFDLSMIWWDFCKTSWGTWAVGLICGRYHQKSPETLMITIQNGEKKSCFGGLRPKKNITEIPKEYFLHGENPSPFFVAFYIREINDWGWMMPDIQGGHGHFLVILRWVHQRFSLGWLLWRYLRWFLEGWE